MKSVTRRILTKAVAWVALFCTATQPMLASAAAAPTLIALSDKPLFLGTIPIPKVMLTITKDQQLFKKAYNDYSDLDGDGQIETTYKHTISYYGYFDPFKCYVYDPTDGRFEPTANNAAGIGVEDVAAPVTCSGQWSGNFLNWISMTRMDAVRKLLYGGMRSIDTATTTVLERAYLPADAHAWAKYYNPSAPGSVAAEQPPINQLTPFSGIKLTTTSSNQNITRVEIGPTIFNSPITISAALATNPNVPSGPRDPIFRFQNAPTGFGIGDQIRLSVGTTGSITGAVKAISGNDVTLSVNPASILGTGSATTFSITNLSDTGISFCNVTTIGGGATNDLKSQSNTQPPLIRVARGNFALWSSNERFQCLWSQERSGLLSSFLTQPGSNGNHAILSGINANAENPSRTSHGLQTSPAPTVQGEYIARVQVCVSDALRGSEKCRAYGTNLKPFGLLQEYGDDDRIHFGLMTGSYTSNTNGGVLRKNIGSFQNELNADGTFSNANAYRPPGMPRTTSSTATTPGIVNTLNYMRIYGYNYGANYGEGTYLGNNGDNCDFQLIDLTPGECTSWGNPMAEIFFDSLRYMANQPPVATLSTTSKDNLLGLPRVSSTAGTGATDRNDPMTGTPYCAKLNVLVFNAAVSTNEDDLGATTVSSLNGGTKRIDALTTDVGTAEGITAAANRKFFVGRAPGAPAAEFELCTGKTVADLGQVLGICPEGPTLLGSYFIAGLAHHAKTTRIRSTIPMNNPPLPTLANDTKALKVTSYGISLATNTPELVLPVPGGAAGQRVVIQPIYRLVTNAGLGGGALVDMKFVSQTFDATSGIATGKVYVNWEDSEQGGDYDQDMWGIIEWTINRTANTITVTSHAISSSTNGQQGFGYTISGTNRDGPHFFSGLAGFNFTDPAGAVAQPANFAGCSNCLADSESGTGQKGRQTVVYNLSSSSTAESLKDPLWYLAKYGGFSDQNNNGVMDGSEWDLRNAAGTTGPDGIPDNFFQVTNPLGLEVALRAAFDSITRDTTATSVAANTTSLQTDTNVYAASFDPRDWSGNLKALTVASDGTLDLSTPAWDAQAVLRTTAHTARNIFTLNESTKVGALFQWGALDTVTAGSISSGLRTLLKTHPVTNTVESNTRGRDRLNFLRGDRSNEAPAVVGFRQRSADGPLGDIINSNPTFVGAPNANIFDTAYTTFRNTYANRSQMVYVAANDGMLHGFRARDDASGPGGQELIAYVPSKTFPHLAKLTHPSYAHRSYVDGSPEVADAFVNNAWKTVLVGALGGGGQSLYALDVTDPSTFSSAPATSRVLWEFNDTDDADLGYVIGQPVIRKMANGKWAAIVSAGYNTAQADGSVSATANAHLFIIFLDGPNAATRVWTAGTHYIKINTGVGTSAVPNGLARPLAADVDANGTVDFIYAGDLRGNLWKFDVSSSDPANWTNSSRRVTLFTALGPSGAVQPITAQAEGALHPSGQGFIINFGTGKYLEPSDVNPTGFQVQSYYGIWDKNDGIPNAQTRVAGNSSTARQQLLQQVLIDKTVGTAQVREIQRDLVGSPAVPVARTPDWSTDTTPGTVADDSPPKDLGWYMDFPSGATTGERAVFTPLLRGGRLIFTTVIPSSDPCQFGGDSVLMVLDPATGAGFDRAVIDITGDGLLNTSDASGGDASNPVYASGLRSEIGITNTPRLIARPGTPSGGSGAVLGGSDPRKAGAGIRETYAVMCGSSGACASPLLGLSSMTARVSWREVMKD